MEQPDGGQQTTMGLHWSTRRRKAATYPELTGDMGCARLVVLAAEVGGRFSTETEVFLEKHWPRQSLSLLLNC